ncbi:MAG: DAK2 domain-containing protein [Chloroflexi bacterium]|nr:DAK2 domain-containing protein [Chloroflexota bacterium]
MSKGPETAVRLRHLSGPAFKAALATAATWLQQRADAINALNVFPVPDGDTGLNMSLTLASAAEQAGSATDDSIGQVASAMARGALLGSRGNSGVILAKLLGGFARAVAERDILDAEGLARALRAGADAAYEALANPVEGTILTVARAAADGAEAVASRDVLSVVEAAHRSAQIAVAETPELLPVLKEASVVDAGGEGYRVLLEGILFHLRGEPLPEGSRDVSVWADLTAVHQDADDSFGYCTEVLVQGHGFDSEVIRARVSELGTSVLVVGESELVKMHVHTPRPGAVLDLATELGELVKVKVDNMQLQHREFAARAATAGTAAPPVRSSAREAGTGLVAVASGSGLQRVFESLGAEVVDGKATMNPSVQDIARAIETVHRTEVLILPNNKNVVLGAEEAARLAADRVVRVLPTMNVAQGIAAALAVSPEAGMEPNLTSSREAAAKIHCLEMTHAARSAKFGALHVAKGQCFGLLDDKPAAAADTFQPVLQQVLGKLHGRPLEFATIYIGADGREDIAEDLRRILEGRAGVEVELVPGGQPHYPYIISLE